MTDWFLPGAGAISNNRGPRCCKHSTMIVVGISTGNFREVLGVEFVMYLPAAVRVEYFIQQMKHESFIQQKGNVLRIS